MSNVVYYPEEYQTTDNLEEFKKFIENEGGSTTSVMAVGRSNSQRCSKLSLHYFSSDMRKRSTTNVS